jgi:hypothetical protein
VTVSSTTAPKETSGKDFGAMLSNEVPDKIDTPKTEKPEEQAKTIIHQGKVLKVSKKAYKLEMERKKQEKLKNLALLDAQQEMSNVLI